MKAGQDEAVALWTPEGTLSRLEAMGGRAAVVSVRGAETATLSGQEVAALVRGIAAALQERGIGRGDTVALHAANSAEWIATGLACGCIGALLAPIDALTKAGDARAAAEAVGAALLVTDRPEGEGPDGPTPEAALADLARARPDAAPDLPDLGPEEPIAVFRTSGTTGTPKVFRLSRGNLGFNVAHTVAAGLVTAADRVLMPLPMHHVFPWIVGTLVPLDVGAPVILPEGMTGPEIAAALKRGEPTVAVGVPKLFEAVLTAVRQRLGSRLAGLLDRIGRLDARTGLPIGPTLFGPVRRAAAPRLRLMVSGGAKLDPASRRALETLGWDVRCGYGLSETAAIFTGELRARRAGTEGLPLPGCEVRIETPKEDGTGEILLRGPNVFSGYIDNPEENARAFDADGFFRTGDLGRVDPDGFLIVTGRSKEIIVLGGGENIHPEDLEKRYEAADDIAEIAVLEHGGALVALVVPDMARIARHGSVDPETAVRIALSGAARDMPSTHRLTSFRIWREPLPRTRLGKLRRFLLPDLYERAGDPSAHTAAALTDADRAWLEAEPRRTVWALVTEGREPDEVGLDTNLALGLRIDSFAWMTLALRIEESVGVRLEAADIAAIETVRDLLERVTDLHAEGPSTPAAGHRAELDAAVARWLAPQTRWERIAGTLTIGLIRLVIRLFVRLRVEGTENLPSDGPALICPNHSSFLDPLVVSAALPLAEHRRTVWAADAVTVFGSPILRRVARPFRVFPVERRAYGVTIGLATESLRRGNLQVWFPEGWRSVDGTLLPFEPGTGTLIRETGAPAVPVHIVGATEAWPRNDRFPRLFRPVTVRFSPPVPAAELIAAAGGDEAPPRAIAVALRDRHPAAG